VDTDELSEPERLLRAAFPRGTWVDLRTGDTDADDPATAGCWAPARTVRSEAIAALLLGACDPERGYLPAVRIRGALIIGRLELIGALISYRLMLENCRLEEAPLFVEATTKAIRIEHSHLPGFNGARMRTEGILSF
jgi:hypothetical protein